VEEVDCLTIYRIQLRSFDPADSFFWPAAAARLRAVVAAERPDVIHFHNVVGLGANLLIEAAQSVPVAVTLHDPWGYCFKQTLLRNDGSICTDTDGCAECLSNIRPEGDVSLPIRLRRDYVAWALDHADLLIAPSHYLAEAYRQAGFDPARIAVQSNGIDLRAIDPPATRPAPPVRFLVLAYLGAHKGISDLLDAASRLAARPDLAGRWQLDIAGDGDLRPQIEADIAAGRFGGALRLLGRISRAEVLRRLTETHVVMLPARWPENEPVSLLEAIASGCAQIATDVGGNPELVVHGASGWLVPRGDPAALAEAMIGYVMDPELAARHGQYNVRRRHHFDEDATVARIEFLYDRLAAAPRSPPVRRPLVICGGGWPGQDTAAICNVLHWAEGGERVRLLWHAWLPDHAWEQAGLVWNWSAIGDPALLRRSVRTGVPVLAPAGSPAAEVSGYGGSMARLYASAADATRELLAIRGGGRERTGSGTIRSGMVADLVVAASPRDSFESPAPRAA